MIDKIATIIIVTHNSHRWLGRLRTALESQTEQRFRLIVFDNASRTEERPRPSELPASAEIIQSEANIGFAAGNNAAATRATSPFLVFLNPDAFPEPDWLARLIAVAEQFPQAAAIGSTQVRADEPSVFDGAGDVLHASGLAYRSNYGRPRKRTPPLGESFAVCGAAMLVRRDAFEAAAGFDERYFCYFEDVDLCFRLRLAGYAIVQCPDATIAHVGGGSAGARSAFADYHGARNRLWTFVKCMPSPLFWALAPLHLIASTAAVTHAFLRGRGLSAWRGFLAGVAGLPAIWRSRQALQRVRRVKSAKIARMLAWSPTVFIGRQPVIRPLEGR